MIFQFSKNKESLVEAKYVKEFRLFELSGLKELIYNNNKPTNKNLEEEDKYFFSDIVSSMFKKLYENGLINSSTTVYALLSCSYHLQLAGYKFLGFIKKDDEVDSRDDDDIECYQSWDFDINTFHKESKVEVSDFFDIKDFEQEKHNVFFVAGTQSFETLALRIKRASLVISLLYNNNLIVDKTTKIILSGRNNAFNIDSKVNYSNESITMSNLISYRLKHYTNGRISDQFLKDNISLEMNSRNSKENIKELHKIMTKFNPDSQKYNLFIVSSTPHLLQLKEALIAEGITTNDNINLFLIGAENPSHKFEIYNSNYIKYLINETIFRNTKGKLF